MKDDLGSDLQLKSRDELVGPDGKFKIRGARRIINKNQNLATPHSEDDKFFDARDNLGATLGTSSEIIKILIN